ncbi:hypothetical protein JI664_05680 [Rhodobacter sp. NTK016B]|uniref:DUF7282 domain-containing protein n=1 Tax=Rhodobacter sp. NTK016B TaxID=2759676 RepID=UPI001A8D333B|nr:hypothetical protein [Rhodobacter sp. NTK016B]MBN8291443.1 hypothetical protein [Rhodobacter sp. NTK016B]
MKSLVAIAATATVLAAPVLADDHMMPMVEASDQSVANGVVSAERIVAPANGWMVVHRTDADMAPGPVVGYAPIREGETADVAAILTEAVEPGDMLMLMVHGEDGGMSTGIFEYTLGASEDGPVRLDGNLVMTVITAQ